MTKKHSDITASDEIHTPKGFTEAANETALIKDNAGELEYRSLSELGATGPEGPPGTTLVTIAVANINTPIELASETAGTQGDNILVYEAVASGPNPFTTYTWDTDPGTDTFYNPPFTVPSTGGTWINTGSGFHQTRLGLDQVSASKFHGSFRHTHREGRGYFLHGGRPQQVLSRVGFARSVLSGTEVNFFEDSDDVYKTKTLTSNTTLTFVGYQHGDCRKLEITSDAAETLTLPSYARVVGKYLNDGSVNYLDLNVIDEGTFATGTVTIISNSFDAGDIVTINGVDFIIDADWSAGATVDESAWNLAYAISSSNNSAIKGKVNVDRSGTVITVTDRIGGLAGNAVTIAVTDNATSNFTISGATLTGGLDGLVLVNIYQEGSAVDDTARIALTTSLLSGCEITINADNTKFDISAGLGIHVDNTTNPGTPVVTAVIVPEQLAISVTNIGTQTFTSLSVDISGNIIQRSAVGTPTQRRDTFQIGSVVHQDLATIVQTIRAFVPSYDVVAQLNDLMDAFGFFLTGGNEISGVSSTLSIQKAVGTGFATGINIANNVKDPHNTNLSALNPINFFEVKQDGVLIGQDTFLDPTTYDNAGTITTVPNNNNATIQYLYLFATGQMSILKGQEVYANFAAAVDASGTETVVVPTALTSGVLMARIVMTKNSSDTTDGAEVRIIPSNAISSGGSGGAATTMQQGYDTSVAPQIILDAGNGGIQYRDASTPIGTPLFEIQNNAGTEDYLSVEVGALKTDTQAYSSMNTLTDASTIATNCSDGNVHEVTLTDNRTLGAPTNLKDGATYIWIITQDATGSRTLAYNSVFKFPGGTAPTLTTDASAVDILTGVSDGTNVYCSLSGDFS